MTWPPEGFVYASSVRGPKLACAACGAKGYSGGTWMDVHRRPHLPCRGCGRQMVVKLDGGARCHTRCPQRAAAPSTACSSTA